MPKYKNFLSIGKKKQFKARFGKTLKIVLPSRAILAPSTITQETDDNVKDGLPSSDAASIFDADLFTFLQKWVEKYHPTRTAVTFLLKYL
jgi:hypothetical protein